MKNKESWDSILLLNSTGPAEVERVTTQLVHILGDKICLDDAGRESDRISLISSALVSSFVTKIIVICHKWGRLEKWTGNLTM